jgi:succinyl-diaminopimelate desuccinylase
MSLDVRAHLQERLVRDRDKIISLVQEMTRIPSENPPGDTRQLFDFVAGYLDQHGAPFQRVDPVTEWPNVLGTFEGGEPGRHLVLNGHLDVFPAGDPSLWTDDPFSGALKDGKVYGRGITDMKTGTAASILTYIYLHEVRQHLKGRLTLTCVSDEETGGPWGSLYLLENYPEARGDCVLNGEPSTPSTVRFGEKGPLWIEMWVRTKGSHGAYPQASANAIKIAEKIVGELEQLTDTPVNMPPDVREKIEDSRDRLDALLGAGATDNLTRVTVNIGMIDGGTKVNMTAAHCRVEVDIRCPVGVPHAVVLKRFEEILSRHEGTSYRIVGGHEPTSVDPNHEMVRIVQRNAEAVRGIRPFPNISLGGTDCRLWRARGIPAFVYGPTPYNMGAPDEYVTLDDLLGTAHVHVLSAYDYLMGADD